MTGGITKVEMVLVILIAGEFILGILGIACEFALQPFLPSALRTRFRQWSEVLGSATEKAA